MRIEGVPLFPLNVVLFPGMVLPLHIFEERYKQMIRACLSGDARFGVVLISEGREVGGAAQVHGVGSLARIVRVGRYDDGRMDLVTVGTERFRILSTSDRLPYLSGDVEVLADGADEGDGADASAGDVRALLDAYRELLGAEGEGLAELPGDARSLSYVAGVLDIPNADKQALLESSSTVERLRSIGRYLRREIALYEALGPTRAAHPPRGVSLN